MAKDATSSMISSLVSIQDWKSQAIDGYFLVESAINPGIPRLAESQSESGKLYWGEMGKVHASISPYLVKLNNWETFENDIAVQEGWGVWVRVNTHLVLSQDPLSVLLHHLREWTLVESPDKVRMLLRMSDFEVLKVLLSASNADELNGLFGPIAEFAYWQKGMDQVMVLSLNKPAENIFPHRSPQVLSPSQYYALQIFAHRHQHNKYAEHLKTHHAEVRQWDSEMLSDFLLNNINKATHYRFTAEKDVVRYLSLAVVLGELFYESSWAKQQLERINIEGTTSRMDALYQRAVDEMDRESQA